MRENARGDGVKFIRKEHVIEQDTEMDSRTNSDKWTEGLERVPHKNTDEQIQVEFVDGILLKSKQAITTHLYLTEQVSPIHGAIGTTLVISVPRPPPLVPQMIDMDMDSFSADVAQ